MEIITLQEARRLGLKFYFTGVPCKNGHVCERIVNRRACLECHRIRDRRTKAHWYASLSSDRRTDLGRLRRKRSYQWIAANRERYAEYKREWNNKNPEKGRAYRGERRARLLNAQPAWVDLQAIKVIYEVCPEGYHVDHQIPLSHPLVCGLHVPWNLEPIPALDNRKKSNKFDPETYVHTFPDEDYELPLAA